MALGLPSSPKILHLRGLFFVEIHLERWDCTENLRVMEWSTAQKLIVKKVFFVDTFPYNCYLHYNEMPTNR